MANLVATAFAAEQRHMDTTIENSGAVLETFSDAAKHMEQSRYPNGVEGTKECFKRLLEAQLAFKAQRQALANFNYQAGTEETDFAAKLKAAQTQTGLQANFDAEAHGVYQKLLQELREVHGPEEEDGDDDLRMERGNEIAPNRACPVSGKAVMEIDEPVEDQKGFVYEKSAIEAYIRAQPRAVGQPTAGATHQVRIMDLKPARKVLKAQRHAKNQPTQTQRPDESEILDVD